MPPQQANLFTFDWDADVPDETRDRVFDAVIKGVRRWRMEVPFTLALEMGAPLSHLFGQGVVFGAPFLAPLLPGGVSDVQKLSKILERPENVRRLLDRLADEDGGKGRADAPRE